MNAGIENKNSGATAPEGVMDGTPEITEDNLFDLVDSGVISLDEANEWIAEQSKPAEDSTPDDGVADDGAPAAASGEGEVVPEKTLAPGEGGVVPDEGKPFKVYQTQEEFQRDFDKSWGKRYGKQKEEAEKKEAEHNELLADLADLLGVTPDKAAEELKRRKFSRQAETEGKDAGDLYEIDRLRNENELLKKQSEQRRIDAAIADINAQGEAIKKSDPAFDINVAMRNPEFARQVFFTRQTNPERAVEIAYKIFYGDRATPAGQPVPPAQVGQPANQANPVQARPQEGAAVAGTSAEKKPVDFSKMSSEDIRALEKKIMRGEKVEI